MAGLGNLGDHRAAPFKGKGDKDSKAEEEDKATIAERQAAARRQAEGIGEDGARKNAAGANYAYQREVGRDYASAGRASDRAEAQGFTNFNRSNAARKSSYGAELGAALDKHSSEPGRPI